MGAIASQITSLTIVYSAVYSGADQSKHQSSASLAFVWGIHRGPVNSPHKWPVTRKMFPFDDVIMKQPQMIYVEFRHKVYSISYKCFMNFFISFFPGINRYKYAFKVKHSIPVYYNINIFIAIFPLSYSYTRVEFSNVTCYCILLLFLLFSHWYNSH